MSLTLGQLDNDPEAFFRILAVRLFVSLQLTWRNPDNVREAVQETCLRLLRHRDSLHDETSLFSWANRVARNLLIDAKLRSDRVCTLAAEPYLPPAANRRTHHDLEALSNALNQLRTCDRDLLYLSYVSGLSADEVAQLHGCKAIAARQRLCRARQALKQLIEAREAGMAACC